MPDGGLGKYDVVKYLDEHPTRAPQVALALALGSIEGARDFDRKGWQSSSVKAYLELLASWGYDLTDVEREVAGVAEPAAA
jgi:ParB family chromosome partitioning protein